jgi:hypothetical protein
MKIRYHLISTILFITTIGYITSISGNVLKLDGLGEPSYCEPNPQITEETRSYEDFQTFIKKFFSDSTFQKDRILSPLQVYDLDRKRLWSVILKEPVDTLKIVFGNKWKFHPSLATDTLHYEVQIKYARNQVIYVERGTDFGLSTIYKFKIINKKWFLIRIEYINI